MNKNFELKASLLIVAMLALSVAQTENLSKDDCQADKMACASLAANAKDICVEEAKAKGKVARAELEYSYSGKTKDQIKIAVARAESSYAVAKEKCDDLAGNTKTQFHQNWTLGSEATGRRGQALAMSAPPAGRLWRLRARPGPAAAG